MGPARHILIRIKRRSLFLVTLNVERAAIVCTDEGARLALVLPEGRPDLLFSGCRRRWREVPLTCIKRTAFAAPII